ncbi:ricin B lectin domain-containing protein [Mycena metata]|uniref:Ricin B lectin domain-containing protein n=1 Tax=Mycena metata TaxID=1033252 RepID=A0AAD7ISS2_9AGAR|nr:ricin B lectin domain-containing protein [Mycena metata]
MFIVAPLVSAALLLTLSNAQIIAGNESIKLESVLGFATKCLTASSLSNGARVVIEPCGANATSLNSWTISGGTDARGQISTNGFCLDVVDGVDADGTQLQVWKCSPRDTAQFFTLTSGGNIQWNGGSNNKCVDVTDGNLSNGNVVQIWDCDTNNTNQKFKSIEYTIPVWFATELRPPSSISPLNCITAASANANAPITIAPCTSSFTNQLFQDPNNNGQMILSGSNLCITPAGNTLANGTKLVLAPCDDSNAVQFWDHTFIEIVNLANTNFVIDLTDGNTTAGNQLQVWTFIVGNTNQNQFIEQGFLSPPS